jgi:endonuclease-8
MVTNLRRRPADEVGDVLLDQGVVAGIGNVWRTEALWRARVSPWTRVGNLDDDGLVCILREARRLMRASLDSAAEPRSIYRRRICPRCGGRVRSRGQGDANRTAYWCPRCQPDASRT